MTERKKIFRGDRLLIARERAGLTQDDLADNLELGQAQINRYELNKSEPSTPTLHKLASRLKVSVDWLLGLTDDMTGLYADADLSDLARRFAEAADSGDFKKVIDMALDKLKNP